MDRKQTILVILRILKQLTFRLSICIELSTHWGLLSDTIWYHESFATLEEFYDKILYIE